MRALLAVSFASSSGSLNKHGANGGPRNHWSREFSSPINREMHGFMMLWCELNRHKSEFLLPVTISEILEKCCRFFDKKKLQVLILRHAKC